MVCANYYTSVIKNLLPPTARPPPLPSFAVCKLAKARREIQVGMSLLACAICVGAENAGRYRGGCMKHGQDERSGLQFDRGLFGSGSVSAKPPAPLCPGLVSPHRGLCWRFWPGSSFCLCYLRWQKPDGDAFPLPISISRCCPCSRAGCRLAAPLGHLARGAEGAGTRAWAVRAQPPRLRGCWLVWGRAASPNGPACL